MRARGSSSRAPSLVYYYDHPAEIDSGLARDETFGERFEKTKAEYPILYLKPHDWTGERSRGQAQGQVLP